MSTSLYDVGALREREFPRVAESGRIYLNSASTGLLPERSRRAMEDYIARASRPNLDAHADAFEIPERARRLCAQLIGAGPDEIALGFNTSFGLNLAASALPLTSGDRVLLQDGDFPANIYPWLNLSRQGIQVERVPRKANGLPNEDAVLDRLSKGDIRVFSVSAVNFCTGYRADLATLSHECRRHGTYLVVDGIQALGAVPLDVSEVSVDILACGGQKWLLGPHGSGFAYVRRDLIEDLEPRVVGWLGYQPSWDFENMLDYALEPVAGASRFELGSLAFGSLEGFCQSLTLLLELGIEAIQERVRSVQEPLLRWVEARSELEWMSEPSDARRSGILTFKAPDVVEISRRLYEAGVAVSVREGGVRVSVHCFNTREEIERVIAIVDAALRSATEVPG